MANLQITDRQTLQVKWTAVDAEGNPTTDFGGGALSYAVVPDTAGTHAADPSDASGLTTVFTPSDQPGNLGAGIQLQITATGGSLPAPITGTFLVDVVAGTAASFSGTAGTIGSKP